MIEVRILRFLAFKSPVLFIALMSLSGAFGQQVMVPAVHDVVQLSASGSIEVEQDLLSLSLTTTRDGADASLVQSQLKAALDGALLEAKKAAQPGLLDVRTGNFSLQPRYGRDGKPAGWQGSAELILEGRDLGRISVLAGKIQGLTVGSVRFGLSLEQRDKIEQQAQTIAIARFKARATDLAKAFGFGGYALREIQVSSNEQGLTPRPRMMAMEARVTALDAPVPVEAGKVTVVVTVAGTVQLK